MTSDKGTPRSKRLIGYLTPLSVQPGETVSVKVSAHDVRAYRASLVRLVCGDDRPHGTGYREHRMPADFEGEYIGREQPITTGSFALLGELPALDAFAVAFWMYPTLPGEEQRVLTAPGMSVCIEEGRLTVDRGGQRLPVPLQLRKERWHLVALSGDSGRLTVAVTRLGRGSGERAREAERAAVDVAGGGLEAGAWWLATTDGSDGGVYNGRIESPRVIDVADVELATRLASAPRDRSSLLVAAWDFGSGFSGDECVDVSGNDRHGRFYQQPTRAVTGVWWDGTVHRWQDNPDHYGAVHFHDDDLADAGWRTDFLWHVPEDLPSGVYAIKVAAGDDEDLMPVFVRPAPHQQRQPVALLMSTATYLAYANQRLSLTSEIFGDPRPKNPHDAYLLEHPEVGYSLYEYHRDGSGVHFSSRLRPVLNLKPRTIMWSFNADTNLTAWLDAIGQPFDVITDEDLHIEGTGLLSHYRVVITGTHPEYTSTAMLDAFTRWMSEGGRLMYMGGNGFYWRIAHHPSNPAIIEVRRAEDGTRAWIARAGEYYHQFTGEYGGLWRRLGHPPNELVGIGFAAQGFDGGTCYRLNPAAADPRVAFAFEGVTTSDVLGDYGTQGGGAAGEEIDRFDTALGSPGHALVVATSTGHLPGMLRVKEEFHMTTPMLADDKVRADMTFFETPAGGAVFSTGSISFAGALSHEGYDNDVARISGNVLRRFLDPLPFDFPQPDIDPA